MNFPNYQRVKVCILVYYVSTHCCLVAEMIANPFLTKSDTFYFVGDQLVIHNKAEYAYSAE